MPVGCFSSVNVGGRKRRVMPGHLLCYHSKSLLFGMVQHHFPCKFGGVNSSDQSNR
jgi:hypothetical protein